MTNSSQGSGFQPKHLTIAQLADGYAHCYERLFSARSIWRRRPLDWRAVPAYLAMNYLYKKSNWLWPLLIRHRLTASMWRPLVELTRWRHVQFRRRLERQPMIPATAGLRQGLVAPAAVTYAGV